MNAATVPTALIELAGHTFALGTLNAWRDQPSQSVAPDQWLAVAHSNKLRGLYAIPEGVTPYALAPTLAQLHPRAVYCVDDISDLAGGPGRAWLCQILDGSVATDTDTLYPLDDETAQQRRRDDLADAAQLTDTRVYHVASGRDLAEALSDTLDAVDLTVCALHPPRASRRRAVAATLVAVIALAGVAWWYTVLLPTRDTLTPTLSWDTEQRLREAFAAEIDRVARQIPLATVQPYLQHAFDLPHEVLGFRVSQVACDTRQCMTTYTRLSAPLISPALDWARTADPDAHYSPDTDTLTITRTLTPVIDPALSRVSATAMARYWVDFRALVKPLGVSLTVSAPTPITGADAAGVNAYQGEWGLANIEHSALLALTTTLAAIDGVRLARLNWTDGSLNFGGAYVFEQP